MAYHEPVLLHESVSGLNISPTGIYVDVTFGGGGHSNEILKQLTTGKLVAFDQDPDAVSNVPENANLIFVNQNFKHLKRYLRFHGIHQIDGLLADLGVSSHQFDTAGRGFTFREDAPLDMRMGQSGGLTAKDIVNGWEQQELTHILRAYGELPNARSIAALLCQSRAVNPIETTGDLRTLIASNLPQKHWHKQLAQVFQALRIAVNDELQVIKDLLLQSADVIKPGGRLVVIAYHSLEDRLVKNYIREGRFEGEAERDLYGNKQVPFTAVTRKPITPSTDEINKNNRSRSAKLRIAERTAYTQ